MNEYTIEFEVILCSTCGMPFGMSKELADFRRDDHEYFYCPNGHDNTFNEPTPRDLLLEQIEAAEIQNQLLRSDLEYEKSKKENNESPDAKATTVVGHDGTVKKPRVKKTPKAKPVLKKNN